MCDSSPTKLEMAFCLIMGTFDKHAGPDKTLNSVELKELLQTQMPSLCEKGGSGQLDKTFSGMEEGKGVEFPEYMSLMAAFACSCQAAVQEVMSGEAGRPPTELEMAVCLIMNAFVENAGPDCKLNKAEAKNLIQREMPMLCAKGDQAQAEKMFNALDMDGSGHMEFFEYMTFMAGFACAVHEAVCAMQAEQQSC